MDRLKLIYVAALLILIGEPGFSQPKSFNVMAFFTARHDPAHISFVEEAHHWFSKQAREHHFEYDSTSDWHKLSVPFLGEYAVVIFLDTRPEDSLQRAQFKTYVEQGGAWMGFHFSAFALTPSAYAQNWDWYHEEFLGSGEYRGNTWKPTSATLKVERDHTATEKLPKTFRSAPNEWYSWKNDLRKNSDIEILVSIDPSSFPLGTGPKPHEIWKEGYYPVVWTNKKYKMLYINMGHNDMDYGGSEKALSSTFSSEWQNQLILNGLFWLGGK
jgi:uncharacterized protein